MAASGSFTEEHDMAMMLPRPFVLAVDLNAPDYSSTGK